MSASSDDERLQGLVDFVREHNPFQRARLAKADTIPFLTKGELIEDQRRVPPYGTNLSFPIDRYTHYHQTSGTTGVPLKVLDTAQDWAWWRAGLAKTFRAATIGAGDRVALAFSFGPYVQFWAAKEGLQEVGAMAVPLGGMTSVQRLDAIASLAATALMCTPTYALRLSEVGLKHGLEGALASVRRVICTGEPGASLPAVRSRIEERYEASCLDHAGLTEVGPFGYPCPEGGGLHVDEREFVCEILDPDQRRTAPGERGELVLTPLYRFGSPVVRYRTGDVVVNTDEHCPAGHSDRWLPGGIVGRTDDMVVIRGMNVYPSAIEDAVRRTTASGEYRITFYTEPGGMDEIRLDVEIDDGGDARDLQELIRQQLGLRVRVVPVSPGLLPRTDAKSRRVVDERTYRWASV
jgi:phenylacetate-CoA ligase